MEMTHTEVLPQAEKTVSVSRAYEKWKVLIQVTPVQF